MSDEPLYYTRLAQSDVVAVALHVAQSLPLSHQAHPPAAHRGSFRPSIGMVVLRLRVGQAAEERILEPRWHAFDPTRGVADGHSIRVHGLQGCAFTESLNNLISHIISDGRGYSFPVLRAKLLFTKRRELPLVRRSFDLPAAAHIIPGDLGADVSTLMEEYGLI